MNYLSKININDLREKIDYFRSLNLNNLSENEIYNQIAKIFVVDDTIERCFINILIPRSTIFYRVRKLTSLNELSTEQDFWNNPNPNVGRLNLKGEPMLYLCTGNDPIATAIDETHISSSDYFAIISYRAKEEIDLGCLEVIQSSEEIDQENYTKYKLIEDFLKAEFSRDVTKETAYFYCVTRCIAKLMFAFTYKRSEFESDGLIYTSVKTKAFNNVCMQIEPARRKLELIGCAIATKNARICNDSKFAIFGFAKRIKNETLFFEPTDILKKEILPNYN